MLSKFFQPAMDTAFDHLSSQTLEEVKAIDQFNIDFGRTAEVILKVAGEERVHYLQEKDIDLAKEKSAQFLKEIEAISPLLKTAIVTKLHQGGAFYSGRFAMQSFILLSKGLGKQDSKHKFVIEVLDENRVIIEEIVEYTSLKLLSLEDARERFPSEAGPVLRALTEIEKKILARERQSCLTALDQSAVNFSTETDQLVFSKPLAVTVHYELKYCPQEGRYQLVKPSEDNITIPEKLIEKLLLGPIDTRGKLTLFFEQLIKALKTAILKITETFFSGEQPSAESDYTKSPPGLLRPGF